MDSNRTLALASALALVFVLVVASVPAPVAAEQSRSGATVVVEEGETVNEDLTVTGGTLIVRGTVNGDLDSFTGNTFIEGEVTGDANVFSGNTRVNGTVSGSLNAFGGNVAIEQEGAVSGDLEAAAGNVIIDGRVGGDAEVGAASIVLGSTAVIAGDLEYAGELERDPGARVDGVVEQNEDVQVAPVQAPVLPNWVGAVYGLLANFLLGALVLLVFPTFSNSVGRRVQHDPLYSGGVGLLLFVGVPIVLLLFAITIIGIPISLVGILVYGLVLWLGSVYGAFGIGRWLLALADSANRWAALLVGLVAVALVSRIPVLGGLVNFVVLLLGLGALAATLWARYRGRRVARRAARAGATTDTTATED